MACAADLGDEKVMTLVKYPQPARLPVTEDGSGVDDARAVPMFICDRSTSEVPSYPPTGAAKGPADKAGDTVNYRETRRAAHAAIPGPHWRDLRPVYGAPPPRLGYRISRGPSGPAPPPARLPEHSSRNDFPAPTQ